MSTGEVDAMLLRRNAGDEKGGADHQMIASMERDLFATHRPIGERPERTRRSCGNPWPCGGYAYGLSPD